jgi:1,4-alpha-glucan branching enzyme
MNVSDSTEKKTRQPRAKSRSNVKTTTGGRRAKTNSELMGTEASTESESAGRKAAPKRSRTASAKSSEMKVKFAFKKPDAAEVYLAGAFNDWDTSSIPLERNEDGTWTTVIELSPGRYEYNFIVDGNWMQDISCSEMVTNPFGTRNCIITVG